MTILKLYKNVNFKKEDKFIIDDFSFYLSKFPYTQLNIQYQKIELQKEIKIILNQEFSNPLTKERYAYCSIQNDNEKVAYYFIDSINWKSSSCCALSISLDILNSFKLNEDYKLTNRSQILREHRDRMKYVDLEFIGDFQDLNYINAINEDNEVDDEKIAMLNNYITNSRTGRTYLHFNEQHAQQLERNTIFGNIAQNNLYIVFAKNGIISKVFGSFEDFEPGLLNVLQKENKGILGTINEYGINANGNHYIIVNDEMYEIDKQFSAYFITQGDMIEESMFYSYEDYCKFMNMVGYYGEYNYSYKFNCERIIDRISENMNPILYHKCVDEVIDINNQDWYLLYKSDETSGVKCFLVPQYPTIVDGSNIGFSKYTSIIPSMIQEGKYYRFICDSNVIQFKTRTNQTFKKYFTPPSSSLPLQALFEIFRVGDTLHINAYNIEFVPSTGVGSSKIVDSFSYTASTINFISSESITSIDYEISNLSFIEETYNSLYGVGGTIAPLPIINKSGTWVFELNSSYITLDSIDSIDKTDSKIIKIIKLPYLPCDFEIDNNKYYIISSDFKYENGLLECKNLNYKFKRQLKGFNIYNKYFKVQLTDKNYDKSTDFESKLLSSEFFTPKYFYDSFGFIFALEDINLNYIDKENNNIQFYVTSTINSRFAFEFDNYRTESMSKEDFNNWLIASRNNEVVIYNSEYLNYIRNGYNYDVKSKQRSEIVGGIGIGLSSLSSIVSAFAGGPAGAVAGGTTIASSVAYYINSVISNEQAIEQKKQQLKAQSASVEGSDDVDLMSVYGKNRLLFTEYTVSEPIKKLLFELFYLNGYRTSEYKIPIVNSRTLFNYLEANVVIENTSTIIDEEIQRNLIEAYQGGLTFIHKFKNNYDLSFTKDNLERSIYNYVNN